LQSPHLEAFKTKTKNVFFSKNEEKRPLDGGALDLHNTPWQVNEGVGLVKVVNCHLRPDSSESMADSWSYPRPFMAKKRSFKAMALTIHQYFVSSPEGQRRVVWQVENFVGLGLVLEKNVIFIG